MKTKVTLLKTLFLVLCCTMFGLKGSAQSSVQVLLKNDVQVSPTELQVDVFLTSGGPGTFELSGHQYGINYNAGIKNGGTITAAWLAGSTQLTNSAQLSSSINTTANPTQIRIAAPPAPGAGNGSQIQPAPNGTRVGTLRIMNTVPFAQVTANLVFNTTLSNATNTLTRISWYNGTTNTIFCNPGVTAGCTGSATYAYNLTNPILNAPTCTAPSLSASTVAATCAGGNDGSINLDITGGSPTPLTILWSNGANTEDLSGLVAGTYTVTVSTDGGGCSASASYTVADGAANVTYYADVDGDTYGNNGASVVSCTGAPFGYVAVGGDCDDNNGAINPGAAEICNGLDDDCDGTADDGLTFLTYYVDGDGDNFGAGPGTSSCSPIAGSVTVDGDCNDANAAINPNAAEVCNGIDDDCDGTADDGLTFLTYYVDADGDTYGDASATGVSSCSPISGSVTNNGDCNDANNAVNPGATEVCNTIDDDCDGSTDEGVTSTFYADADGDTYGNAASSV